MVGDIFQPTHLIFVLVVALLVLGPKKLPEVGRQLGSGIRDFRAAINGEHNEPDKVSEPYEQVVTDTPAEHEFAHETASAEPHFADETASAEPHFADEAPVQASSNGHEFAHEPETSAGDHSAEHGGTPDRGHEFAYETSEPSDKRTDPLA
jgi:sec-independent protein translocase protein TatA